MTIAWSAVRLIVQTAFFIFGLDRCRERIRVTPAIPSLFARPAPAGQSGTFSGKYLQTANCWTSRKQAMACTKTSFTQALQFISCITKTLSGQRSSAPIRTRSQQNTTITPTRNTASSGGSQDVKPTKGTPCEEKSWIKTKCR